MSNKEFVLPKTWYIVVTEENQQVVSDWRFLDNDLSRKYLIPIGCKSFIS